MDPTPERIIAAATRVLGDDSAASMREVALASGVGRATLYRHFAGREELIGAIRLQALRDARAALGRADADEGTPDAAIERALRRLLPVLDRYRVLLDAAPPDRSDPEHRALLEAIEGPLGRILARGRRDGTFTTGAPEGFQLEMVIGAVRAARRAVAVRGVDPADAEAAAVRALLGALRA